jgi:hypothetical protein
VWLLEGLKAWMLEGLGERLVSWSLSSCLVTTYPSKTLNFNFFFKLTIRGIAYVFKQRKKLKLGVLSEMAVDKYRDLVSPQAKQNKQNVRRRDHTSPREGGGAHSSLP